MKRHGEMFNGIEMVLAEWASFECQCYIDFSFLCLFARSFVRSFVCKNCVVYVFCEWSDVVVVVVVFPNGFTLSPHLRNIAVAVIKTYTALADCTKTINAININKHKNNNRSNSC